MLKVTAWFASRGQPVTFPALPRPASSVPDTVGHGLQEATHESGHPRLSAVSGTEMLRYGCLR